MNKNLEEKIQNTPPEIENKEIQYSEDKNLNKPLSSVASKVRTFSDGLQTQINKLVEIGRALSVERNLDKLLDMIVDEARSFTNADAGTLYIREEKILEFQILQNDSMQTRMGGSTNNPITFPPGEAENHFAFSSFPSGNLGFWGLRSPQKPQKSKFLSS